MTYGPIEVVLALSVVQAAAMILPARRSPRSGGEHQATYDADLDQQPIPT
jgi:hypothetical protein